MEIAELFAQMRLSYFLLLPLMVACSPQRDAPSSAIPGAGSGGHIFGGTVVITSPKGVAKYLPYAAFFRTITYNPKTKEKKYHTCSVATLAPDIMAINAHCLHGDIEDMRVVFGAPQITWKAVTEDADGEMSRKVVDHRFYPLFSNPMNRKYNPYDIALVILDRPAPEGTKYFGLSSTSVNPTTFPKLKVLGYGKSTAVIDETAATQPTYKMTGEQYFSVVRQTVLPIFKAGVFAMDGKSGKGTCLGDSGGPVFKKINGAFVLVGLTAERMAESDDYDQCNVDSISVDIASVKSWILKTVDEMRRDLQRKQNPEAEERPFDGRVVGGHHRVSAADLEVLVK
jgi:secreted trypsin-like serine protease